LAAQGPLASLDAFRHTQLIAPACHDTASAIAGIPSSLDSRSTSAPEPGRWWALSSEPVTTNEAFDARYTNLGAAGPGLCFHSLVNGMWLLKQCMDAWSAEGRPGTSKTSSRKLPFPDFRACIDVDAEPLLLDSDMPERINHQLMAAALGHHPRHRRQRAGLCPRDLREPRRPLRLRAHQPGKAARPQA
jgi:rhamnulokinase